MPDRLLGDRERGSRHRAGSRDPTILLDATCFDITAAGRERSQTLGDTRGRIASTEFPEHAFEVVVEATAVVPRTTCASLSSGWAATQPAMSNVSRASREWR